MTKLTRKNFARPAGQPMRAQNGGPEIGYFNTSHLYDSFSVAQAAAFPAMTPMFQVPISGAKTLAQTNMRGQGTLVNSEQFKIRRMRVIVTGNTYVSDAINVLQLCSVKLKKGGSTEFASGPVLGFPGGAGLQVTAAAQLGTAPVGSNIVTGVANGDTCYQNAFHFEDEIEVNSGESIQVDFTAETAFNMTAGASGGLGTTVYVFLDGKRLRPVN